MAPSFSRETEQSISEPDTMSTPPFPMTSQLESTEQIRRFELLRLAFFALKLRKLEQRFANEEGESNNELEFRRSLLRHVIFQQVLTLIQLDARQQTMQIIEACQR